MYLFLCFTGSL